MEIIIKDPLAPKLHLSYGISEDRANEISREMDIIMEQHIKSKNQSYAVLTQIIAAICNTNEEMIYAITNNYNFLIRKGYIQI